MNKNTIQTLIKIIKRMYYILTSLYNSHRQENTNIEICKTVTGLINDEFLINLNQIKILNPTVKK